MHFDLAASEPAASTFGKFGGLGSLSHSYQFDEEAASYIFAVRGHGELDVVNDQEWWGAHADILRDLPAGAPHGLGRLLLGDHDFAVLDRNAANGIGKFQAIPLFGELLLERVVDQRGRNTNIANFEFCRVEGGVTIFGAKVARNRNPNFFASNFCKEMAVCQIAVEVDVVVLDVGLCGGIDRSGHGRSGIEFTRRRHGNRTGGLGEGGCDLRGVDVDLGWSLARGTGFFKL